MLNLSDFLWPQQSRLVAGKMSIRDGVRQEIMCQIQSAILGYLEGSKILEENMSGHEIHDGICRSRIYSAHILNPSKRVQNLTLDKPKSRLSELVGPET